MGRLAALLVCALLAAPGAALAESGSQVWSRAGCGGCHTLAAAGANGEGGPNLDALRPSQAAVVAQVTDGGGGMPAFGGSLSPAEIRAVAAYVASVAGGGSPAPASAAGAGAGAVAGPGALPPPAAWVRRLQRDLALLGYFHHVVTGVYGPITTAAVRAFQAAEHLRVDGRWGPQSQAALVRRLRGLRR
jgi:mono/diheme cytochrome c family protein